MPTADLKTDINLAPDILKSFLMENVLQANYIRTKLKINKKDLKGLDVSIGVPRPDI